MVSALVCFVSIQREEEETAKVLEEFVTTFEETSKAKMMFVRGAVINPDKGYLHVHVHTLYTIFISVHACCVCVCVCAHVQLDVYYYFLISLSLSLSLR